MNRQFQKPPYPFSLLVVSGLLLCIPSSFAQNGSSIQQQPNAWQYMQQGGQPMSAPGNVRPNGMPQQTAPSLYGQTQMQYQQQPDAAQTGATQTSTAQPAPAQVMAAPVTDVIMTTTPTVEGYRITSYKGLVEGVQVRLPTWQQNMAAGFQGMFGGSVEAYAQMCEQGRVQAYNTLMQRARGMGANAVVGIHFDSESFSTDKSNFANAVVCYGTAVLISPLP